MDYTKKRRNYCNLIVAQSDADAIRSQRREEKRRREKKNATRFYRHSLIYRLISIIFNLSLERQQCSSHGDRVDTRFITKIRIILQIGVLGRCCGARTFDVYDQFKLSFSRIYEAQCVRTLADQLHTQQRRELEKIIFTEHTI